jgi:hypothetical protein
MELAFAKQQLNHTLDIVRRRDVDIQRLLFVNQLHHQRQAEVARQLMSTLGVLASAAPVAAAASSSARTAHAAPPPAALSDAAPRTPTPARVEEIEAASPEASGSSRGSLAAGNAWEDERPPSDEGVQAPADNDGAANEANNTQAAAAAAPEASCPGSDAALLAAAESAARPNSPAALAAAGAVERAQSFVQLYENGRMVKVAPELAAKLQRQQRLNRELEHAAVEGGGVSAASAAVSLPTGAASADARS